MPTAPIDGSQRKILTCSVSPSKGARGAEGIPLRGGRTLPFKVARQWIGPEGYYPEQWFLVDPGSREVLHEGPGELRLIWGLQAPTDLVDEVAEPITLPPGTYLVVFALGGIQGGELEVVAAEVPAEEAA